MELNTLILAVDVPESWIVGIALFVSGTVAPAAWKFIQWVINREAQYQKDLATALSAQTAAFLADQDKTRERYKVIIAQKEGMIEHLSKDLSRKSDETAKKVQELLTMTLDKVEGLGEKNDKVLDRALGVMADFTTELRVFNERCGERRG